MHKDRHLRGLHPRGGSASRSRLLSLNGGLVAGSDRGLTNLLDIPTEPTGRLELPTGGLRKRPKAYLLVRRRSFTDESFGVVRDRPTKFLGVVVGVVVETCSQTRGPGAR